MSAISGSSPQMSHFISPTPPPPLTQDTPSKEKPKRCCAEGCKKKLGLLDFTCKCGSMHCAVHRSPETHNCSYDFKKDHHAFLMKTMSTPIVAEKLNRV